MRMEKRFRRIAPSSDDRLTTPRSAAVAGILFSVLLSATMVLLRTSAPAFSQELQDWTADDVETVRRALYLVPFAGIAFLWFMGVVRDRFGANEDRFFSTVFFGSGLLFLASLFIAAGVGGAALIGLAATPKAMIASSPFFFGRLVSGQIMNVFTLKMAGVFMVSTATLATRTRILPPWITLPGYGCAGLLLLGSHFIDWAHLVFPLWVLVLSVYILADNARKGKKAAENQAEETT